ncbi:helix-turn-helix domain-containing protein [Halovivax sp.]|uniref:DUF7351 domain-containing protein n=1 Tax=Halovivax sp. TaxID=1935978 RepID=UPI0025C4CE8A|nr:helix-turn-helix domain-containing protein [Halovivax sp.]
MQPSDEGESAYVDAADAFSVLGNETRMAVLGALWEADEPMTYAELRREVAPDDRGNFHYHLGKLADHFVRKVDGAYELRFAGVQVVRTVVTGTLTSDPSIPPVEVDTECGYCGRPMELCYEDERITLRCTDCAELVGGEMPPGAFIHCGFPPAGLDGRSPDELVEAAETFIETNAAPMLNGVCPECAGRTATTISVCDDHAVDESGLCSACETRYESWAVLRCRQCQYERKASIWYATLHHPAVVSFLYDHGHEAMSPFRSFTSDLARIKRDIGVEVVETDPYLFRVMLPIDGERLSVTVTEELAVEAIERHTAETCDD